MRFLFKTHYNQDIDHLKHGGDRFWYGLLLLLVAAAPAALGTFYLGELNLVMIYAIAGVGLMLLVGYTGQVSLGHAAFLAIGAYTHSLLLGAGLPFLLSILAAVLVSALVGAGVGWIALRMTGIYLAIATLAFAMLTEQTISRAEWLTGGFRGLAVPQPSLFGMPLTEGWQRYYLTLALLVVTLLMALNILRSSTGRAMVAIRDSEISAESVGINLAVYKTLAFALSAGITGLAGALFAHRLGYLSPDAFTFLISLQLLLMVVVGGVGSMRGVIYGALFIGFLPQLLAIARDTLPPQIAQAPGLEPGIFGLILVLVILFEPQGIFGRWLKIKSYFQLFPLYRRATHRRQKTYLRTERLR